MTTSGVHVVAVDLDRVHPESPRRSRLHALSQRLPATAHDLHALGLRRVDAEYLAGNGTITLDGSFDQFWPLFAKLKTPDARRPGMGNHRGGQPGPARWFGPALVNPLERERRCLGCGRSFMSHGPGNRLCERCGPRADATSPYAI